MKTLVVYYSKTGSNGYLAKRIAAALGADREELRPRLDLFFFLMIFSLIGKGGGIRKLRKNPGDYDHVVLCGPIWMGRLISPLRGFLGKYGGEIKRLSFASCCGGGEDTKDDKFGYAGVFRAVEGLARGKCLHCEAFPIGLVLPEDKKEDSTAVMNTRLGDENFTGPMEHRFDDFIRRIQEPNSKIGHF
jgi:flavodoxin